MPIFFLFSRKVIVLSYDSKQICPVNLLIESRCLNGFVGLNVTICELEALKFSTLIIISEESEWKSCIIERKI